MAELTVNVDVTAINTAIAAEAAARVSGDAASVATASSDATTKANAAQAAAIASASTDATTKANAAQAAAISAAATDATTKANSAQAAAIAASQPLDSDLTAIAGLTPANGDVIQRKAGVWTNRTLAEYLADQTAGIRALSASTVLSYTGGSVVNNTTTLSDIHSSAGFTISEAGEYNYEFLITYDAAATTTGIRLSVNGTAAFSYLSGLVSAAVQIGDRSTTQLLAYGGGFAAPSSAGTSGNIGLIRGSIIVTAAGSFVPRFCSEVGGSAITVTNVIGRLERTA